MGLGSPSYRSTALIRQMIKISRRERPTNTSRSFGYRKSERVTGRRRARSAIPNPFVLSWQPERVERENRPYANRFTKSSGSAGDGDPCAVGGQKSDVRSDKPEVVSHSVHPGASGFLVATPGAGADCGWFGCALNTAAPFDVFYRLQVTNYGLFNILFESTPNGSDHVNVWLSCILAQTVSPLFRGNLLATSPGERKLKN